MEFDPRIFLFVIFGLGLMLAVSLEKHLSRFWLSLPIVYVAACRISIRRATGSMR